MNIVCVFVYVFLHSSEPQPSSIHQHTWFWYTCFLHSSEPLFVSYIRIILFWYMHYCTVPNRLFICYMNYTCFGICVFVQLRTSILKSYQPPHVWLYALCSAPKPFQLMFPQGEKCWYMCFFAQLRTYWNISITAFKVLVYEFFARLRTFSNRQHQYLLSFGICVFLYSSEPSIVSPPIICPVLVYAFFVQLRT